MTEMLRFKKPSKFDQLLILEPLEIEALSDVRHIHRQGFRCATSFCLTDDELGEHDRHIESPSYADALMQAIRGRQLFGARIDGTLVGTAGWVTADTASPTARLRWMYVQPMFSDCGIGRRLLSATELDAMRSGYDAMSVQSPPGLGDFLQHLGYLEASRGTMSLTHQLSVPVSFMRKTLVQTGLSALTRH
ncbi:MAG: GNAT family N-acetyltransferase [Pseudomonadota bacterium]